MTVVNSQKQINHGLGTMKLNANYTFDLETWHIQGQSHRQRSRWKELIKVFLRLTANLLEARTIKYTNFEFPAKYMNSRSKLHWNIHVVLCQVGVTWNNRWGIGIPELRDHAERHSTFNSSPKQKQKYRGMFETQKSRNKTSSGDIGLNIRTLASPKVNSVNYLLLWYFFWYFPH